MASGLAIMLGMAAQAPLAASDGCESKDVIGTHRTLQVNTGEGLRVGALQYPQTLPLGPREVVLTFDDGPSRHTTDRILRVLDEHCVKATFFLVGIWAKHRAAITRRIALQGHSLGTHSWSHPRDLSLMTFADARDEVERGFEAVSDAAGRPIARFLRYPGLHDSGPLNGYARKRGYAVFSCDVATDDWRGIGPEAIVERTMSNLARAGHRGIVLFHDTKAHTATALPRLFARLKAGGYRIVHLRSADQYRSGEDQKMADARAQ